MHEIILTAALLSVSSGVNMLEKKQPHQIEEVVSFKEEDNVIDYQELSFHPDNDEEDSETE